MKSFKEIFCDFIKQPDILFFYGFLLTFTLSIRKVLFFYPIGRQFNEYTGIYLYLSDIFIILMLASAGISILYNKILNKSIYIVDIVPYLKQKIIIIPLILVFSSFISTFWSSNWQIAIFRSIKLVEFYLLYLWAIFRVFHPHNVPRLPCSDKLFHVEQFNCYQGGTFLNNVFLIMIGTGIIQSAIGIWQFIIQKSIGTLWLKESLISPEIVGVAKIVFNGEKYIRAYGLFPHPNILGGFLILSIILTILYFKLSHLNKNDLLHQKCSTPALQRQIVPRGTICLLSGWNSLHYSILGIQILTLILTFSKSALVGLVLSFIYLWYKIVPRGTLRPRKLFHPNTNVPPQYKCSTWNILRGKRGTFYGASVEQLKLFALFGAIIFLLILIFRPNEYSVIGKSVQDRMFFLNVSRGTFLENPILGVGAGNFVNSMLKNYPNLEIWQYQPVHNVFLLILNELGIIGFILFVWLVWEVLKSKMFHPDINVPPQYKCSTPVQMFHVEHFTGQAWNILRGKRGTFDGTGVEHSVCYQGGIITDNKTDFKQTMEDSDELLLNNKQSILSIGIVLIYSKAIILGFLFIMLVDHYFWDIQQGQILFWLILAILSGVKLWTNKELTSLSTEK